jgi:hypothetical protein
MGRFFDMARYNQSQMQIPKGSSHQTTKAGCH